MPFRPAAARRAFTLIELLVVIGIIATLMGLLFPALAMIRNAAKKAACDSAMGQISAAIMTYRTQTGAIPEPQTVTATTVDAIDSTGQSNATGILLDSLKLADRDSFGLGGKLLSNGRLVDPWGNPFRYLPFACYPAPTTLTAIAEDAGFPDNVPNPDTFWLWSVGRDTSPDPITGGQWTTMPIGGGDDRPNWKR